MDILKNNIRELICSIPIKDGLFPLPFKYCSVVSFSKLGATFPVLGIPSILVIISGEKSIQMGAKNISFGVGEGLVISRDLPASAIIKKASKENPFLAVQIVFDIQLLQEVATKLGIEYCSKKHRNSSNMSVINVNSNLLESVYHYLHLLKNPDEIKDLEETRLVEIYIRLLRGADASNILGLLSVDSNLKKIFDVVAYIKKNLSSDITIHELAKLSNMSISSFHQHFKNIVNTSPLRYAKRLRLVKARNLMINEGLNASKASYCVGYESPSQFSREYSCFFGQSPRRDVKNGS